MKMDFEIGPRAEYVADRLQAVADEYKLGTIYEHRDLGGVYNLNVLLKTSMGDYVLRVYRPWVSLERIEFLQGIRRRLRAAGLPVPPPLGWRVGSPLGFGSNRLVELEPFIRPEPEVFNWENCIETYAMLGRLHSVLDGLIETVRFVPPKVHNYGHPADLLQMLGSTRLAIDRQNVPSDKEKALEICDQAEIILTRLARWWGRTGKYLPQKLVHGDYGGENILWRRGKIAALLDFDLADIHERVFELAYTTYWMYDRLFPGTPPSQWAWHKLPELLSAYRAQAKGDLSDEELQSLPLEMSRVPLYWIATAGYEADPVKAVLDRARYVENSRWLFTDAEEVLAHINRNEIE